MDGKEDFETITRQILRQAIDDYVKLQHPSQRKKKYLKEAWWTAVDLFFDPDFLFDSLTNDQNKPMNLADFIRIAADRENVDLKQLRSYLTRESVKYWDEREMKTVEVPEDVIVDGHVYSVVYRSQVGYKISYKRKEISLPAEGTTSEKEEEFVRAVTEVIAYHSETKISKKALAEISKGWFRALKVNNCFTGC